MATDDIAFLSDLPAALRQAATRGKLILFVGAGASRLAGCPSWGEFADGALRALLGQGKLSYAQLAQLENLNPRLKLSIAKRIAEEHRVAARTINDTPTSFARADPAQARLVRRASTTEATQNTP